MTNSQGHRGKAHPGFFLGSQPDFYSSVTRTEKSGAVS